MKKIDTHLDKDQKIKMIEILLIVGSILTAFNIPTQHIWLFMLFALFSIFYYIAEQRGEENESILKYIAASVALTFVGIIIYNLGISLIYNIDTTNLLLSLLSIILISIILPVYYIFFVYIIFKALTGNGKKANKINSQIKMPDEEKIDLEKGEEEKDCPLSPTDWVMLLSDEINTKVTTQSAFITITITFELALSTVMAGSIFAFMNVNPELALMMSPFIIKFWSFILCLIAGLTILIIISLDRTKKKVKPLEKILEDIIDGENDSNKIRERWKGINKVQSMRKRSRSFIGRIGKK